MKNIFVLFLFLVSVSAQCAEWQCGSFIDTSFNGLKKMILPKFLKYSRPMEVQLVATNEEAADFISTFNGKILCVKGSPFESAPRGVSVYEAKSGD